MCARHSASRPHFDRNGGPISRRASRVLLSDLMISDVKRKFCRRCFASCYDCRMVDPNPPRAEPDWPPALVAGAYQTGVVLMRNLARRGVAVSCVDCDSRRPAFKTVYGKAHLCPNPDEKPAAWVCFMRQLGAQF